MKKITLPLAILCLVLSSCNNNPSKQVAKSENMGSCNCGTSCGCSDDKNQEGHCGCGPNCCKK